MEEGGGAAWLLPGARGVWLVGLGPEEVHVGRDRAVVAGDIAKGGDGLLGVRPYQGVEVVLEGVEDGDEDVNIVDTNTHLGIVGGRE